MQQLLKHAQWQAGTGSIVSNRVFLPPDPVIAGELIALWRKYRDELAEFAEAYSRKFKTSTGAGFAAVFGDVEGELLYMLIRELKPELVYEISPNSGSSTNYILAAVTRNGTGGVEGFEIEPSFNGVPTRDAIAGNQIGLCDFSRYNLHVGDARQTVAERLKTETPNFCLIDSWHEDVFAEFYVHHLLPRVKGTVLVQDIAHFDPRPEWSTEAAYLLTHMQLTGTELVPIASYEDQLNSSGARKGLTPRRPKRSNSIVLHMGETPGEVNPKPAERYWAAWRGAVDDQHPAICDVLSMWHGRSPVRAGMAQNLEDRFEAFDTCQQVLTLELLARNGHRVAASKLMSSIDLASLRGSQLPLFVARAASLLGQLGVVEAMARKVHEAAADRSIATGYRQLLELADLLYGCGLQQAAKTAFETAIEATQVNNLNARKIAVDLATFCLKHPAHFAGFHRVGLGGRQTIEATAIAGKALLRSAASRAVRRLRA